MASAEMLDRVLDVAMRAARRAGEHMRNNLGTAGSTAKSNSKDLVTDVDKRCQEIVEETVLESLPDHAILGEETTAAGSDASRDALEENLSKEWLWIIDPIDGTTNFVHGVPSSVVSVGAAHRGEVVVGVIFDPYHDELFYAARGRGAHMNDTRLSVDSPDSLEQSLFGFGTHTTPVVRETMLTGHSAMARATRGTRNFGAAALHLAWVAAGRLSGFWELDLNSWDLAAGSLLVHEAGGRCTDTRGEPYSLRTRDILATNGKPAIHDETLRILREAGAASVPGR